MQVGEVSCLPLLAQLGAFHAFLFCFEQVCFAEVSVHLCLSWAFCSNFSYPFREAWAGKNTHKIWTGDLDQKQITTSQYLPLAEKVNSMPGLVLWPNRD